MVWCYFFFFVSFIAAQTSDLHVVVESGAGSDGYKGQFRLFRHKRPQSVSGQCRDLLFSASSLTQSLRSSRSAAASGRSMRRNARETRVIAWRKEGKDPTPPVFPRLSPPADPPRLFRRTPRFPHPTGQHNNQRRACYPTMTGH